VNFRIWWDGDLLSENLDGTIVSKWAYPGMPSGGFTSVTLPGFVSNGGNRVPLYGDMFGDWREEVMIEQSGSTSLRIHTTAIPTEKRLYTLMHNPEYRNAMVEKGYTQSRFVDYYLGEGMADPPRPNITYPGGCAGCPTGGASGGGSTGAGGAGSGGTIVVGGTGGGGGTTGPGATTVASTGGTGVVGPGGTSASGGAPGTGGAAGGNPATGGSTVVNTGGAVVIGTGGTTAVVPETGGSTGSGAGGGAGGESGTGATTAAASSGGCSCAIGATSGRASASYFVIMLGALGLVLNRRRQRGNSRK
jgi:hypothetical protein